MTKVIEQHNKQLATLAGGCFWCIEAAFNQIKGVFSAISGYTGGSSINPTYQEICTGESGHAEVVQLCFDPDIISYQEILEIFFTLHDPTQLNRQGYDIGSQYRSAVFYHDEKQKEVIEELIQHMSETNMFDEPIVTQVTPLDTFYPSEDYHQNYFKNNPNNQYCLAVVSPKLTKFRQTYLDKLK